MSGHSLGQRLGAEAFGTAVLVFLGAGSVTAFAQARGGLGKTPAPFTGAELFGIAAAFGFAVIAMVYAIGKVSGCHINPAVTISLAVTRKIGWGEAVPYVVAQTVGATVGALAIWGVFGHNAKQLGTIGQLDFSCSIGSAFLNEFIGTGILLFTVLGIVDDRGPTMLAGLVIGLIVIGIILTVAPQTGAAINPGRWTGTLIVAKLMGMKGVSVSHFFTYWGADVLGAIAGVVGYDLLSKAREATVPAAEAVPAAAGD